MLHLVTAPLNDGDASLPEVAIQVGRQSLAKRIWRGVADDATEFGFELSRPLKHGDTVFQSAVARYVIQQQPEPLLEISLDVVPSAAAGIGWAVGNLHLELSAEATRLLTPNEPAARNLFARLNVPYRETIAVFRPGRFFRGQQTTHELGTSHRH